MTGSSAGPFRRAIVRGTARARRSAAERNTGRPSGNPLPPYSPARSSPGRSNDNKLRRRRSGRSQAPASGHAVTASAAARSSAGGDGSRSSPLLVSACRHPWVLPLRLLGVTLRDRPFAPIVRGSGRIFAAIPHATRSPRDHRHEQQEAGHARREPSPIRLKCPVAVANELQQTKAAEQDQGRSAQSPGVRCPLHDRHAIPPRPIGVALATFYPQASVRPMAAE